MKTYLFIAYIICLIATSCSQVDTRTKLLTNNKTKYWAIIDSASNQVVGLQNFTISGDCTFHLLRRDGTIKAYAHDDVEMPKSWRYEGRDMINIEGYSRKILKLTEDTLLVRNIKNGETILHVKFRRQDF